MRVVAIAVVLVLALMGASCGGDDSDTASDTDTVVTETEGITAEDTTTDETTDDDGSFATDQCSSLVAAASSVATAFSATGDTGELEEARAEVEEFADDAPDEIRDDLQVLVDAYDELAESSTTWTSSRARRRPRRRSRSSRRRSPRSTRRRSPRPPRASTPGRLRTARSRLNNASVPGTRSARRRLPGAGTTSEGINTFLP